MSNLASEQRELTASDGVHISAYHVVPSGQVRGGLVVLQEIFGVNAHVRSVADRYAQHGYEVIAPALFDRVERGLELAYDDASRKRGMELNKQLGLDAPLRDVQAAIRALPGQVGVVGFCWGGTLAYLAAARLEGLSAAVGYYGGGIARFVEERPRVPTLLHFGERDAGIPLADVERVRQQRPELPIYTYPAGHAFNRDVDAKSYDPASAKLAFERSLGFFEEHL